MRKPGKRQIVVALLAGTLLFGFGVWVLLHPASVFVQPWRATLQSTAANHVLIGPYPVEDDFVRLKQQGVTRIVSLLEPKVPYEQVLLEQERERAARYGIEVLNFPMGSILGQKFGDDYGRNANAAAEAAIHAKGTAYIHCYLGLHRAVEVQKRLAAMSKETRFVGTSAGQPASRAAEFDVYAAFNAGDYGKTLAEIAKLPSRSPRMLSLRGWAYFRLDRMAEARAAFEQALAAAPNPEDGADALSGQGYVALREARIKDAEAAFSRALSIDDDDVQAMEGLAFTTYRQGRREEARALLKRAISLNPDNPETRNVLEKLQATSGTAPPAPTGN